MSTLTIQPSGADVSLRDGSAGTKLYTGYPNGGAADRTLLRFDFSSLPDGATIDSATLSLYYWDYDTSDPVGRTFWAYRLTQVDWTEDAIWTKYDSTHNWATAGGDYTETDGASITVPASKSQFINWDVTNLVKYFQANSGKIANFIMKAGTETSPYTIVSYSRRETTNTTLRPKLVITYTSPEPPFIPKIMIF